MLNVKDLISDKYIVSNITKSDIPLLEIPNSQYLNKIYKYYIINQGNNNLCASSTAVSLNEYLLQHDGYDFHKLSTAYMYYNTRHKMNCDGKNVGSVPPTIIDTLFTKGLCEQEKWNFTPEHIDAIPPEEVFLKASSNIRDTIVELIDIDLTVIKYIIGVCKRPIVASICLSKRFYKGLGIIEPEIDKYSSGHHSILLVGYDEESLIIQNSWGDEWGENGFGRLSYKYINYIYKLWSLKKSIYLCTDNQSLNA